MDPAARASSRSRRSPSTPFEPGGTAAARSASRSYTSTRTLGRPFDIVGAERVAEPAHREAGVEADALDHPRGRERRGTSVRRRALRVDQRLVEHHRVLPERAADDRVSGPAARCRCRRSAELRVGAAGDDRRARRGGRSRRPPSAVTSPITVPGSTHRREDRARRARRCSRISSDQSRCGELEHARARAERRVGRELAGQPGQRASRRACRRGRSRSNTSGRWRAIQRKRGRRGDRHPVAGAAVDLLGGARLRRARRPPRPRASRRWGRPRSRWPRAVVEHHALAHAGGRDRADRAARPRPASIASRDAGSQTSCQLRGRVEHLRAGHAGLGPAWTYSRWPIATWCAVGVEQHRPQQPVPASIASSSVVSCRSAARLATFSSGSPAANRSISRGDHAGPAHQRLVSRAADVGRRSRRWGGAAAGAGPAPRGLDDVERRPGRGCPEPSASASASSSTSDSRAVFMK